MGLSPQPLDRRQDLRAKVDKDEETADGSEHDGSGGDTEPTSAEDRQDTGPSSPAIRTQAHRSRRCGEAATAVGTGDVGDPAGDKVFVVMMEP